MHFFKKKQKPSSISSADLQADFRMAMQRRANDIISALQKHRSREFERVLTQVENGDIERARLMLRALGDEAGGEGYIDFVLRELQTTVENARISRQEALEENPNALRILLRSGNRSEAIELYQKRTGVDWQAALDAIKDLEQKLAQEDAR